MTEQTSRLISALRFPLAVLVIVCHSGFFAPPDGARVEAWDSWKLLSHMELFFCEVLPHISVPLFMLFSGMLCFRKGVLSASGYGQMLKKKARTLLLPYLMWSTLAFAALALESKTSFTFVRWLQGLWDTELWQNGGRFAIDLPGFPENMPLWFMRDLMILFLLAYPLGLLLQKTRGWLLLPIAAWWFPGHEKFFGFGADALFYFALGAWISVREIDLPSALRKMRIPTYIFAAVMLAVETLITFRIYDRTHAVGFEWIPFNIFVVSLGVAVLNFGTWLVEKGRDKGLAALSGSTFFLFAAHYVGLPAIQKALYGLLGPTTQLGNIAFFWLFVVGYPLLLLILFRVLVRLTPRAMSVLCGGRTY